MTVKTMSRINVMLDQKTLQAADKIARVDNVSRSAVLRFALRDYARRRIVAQRKQEVSP